MELTLAQANELETCFRIITEGKLFQQEQGFTQWTDDYPNRETLLDDINKQKGYVLKINGSIACYMCIDFDGEPAYQNIQGKWLTASGVYAVIHRMAFSHTFRNNGLTAVVFPLIEEFCLSKNIGSIRVDTDFPNKRMQHILEKLGYIYCGTVVFQGSAKLTYEKILS